MVQFFFRCQPAFFDPVWYHWVYQVSTRIGQSSHDDDVISTDAAYSNALTISITSASSEIVALFWHYFQHIGHPLRVISQRCDFLQPKISRQLCPSGWWDKSPRPHWIETGFALTFTRTAVNLMLHIQYWIFVPFRIHQIPQGVPYPAPS